jgi:FAD/FMN-containing dehydrogenase/Fe-S oxidoreductase
LSPEEYGEQARRLHGECYSNHQRQIAGKIVSRMHDPTIRLPVIESGRGRSERERAEIAEELRELDIGEVRFDRHSRLLYATDASLYQVEPIGVVVPRDVTAVEGIVRFCAERGIAMLPRGGGTSLAGQCTGRAVVVDLSPNCRRVLELDVAGRQCGVEPGIGIDELNRWLEKNGGVGLFFAPDPATVAQATIGGCIGNNAAGARSIRYGRTSENVAGVEVLLSSGKRLWLEEGAGRRSPAARQLAQQVAAVVRENAEEIRRRFPKLIRRNAGYGLDMMLAQLDRGVSDDDLDLSGLICGSEGTLAIVVAANLKLSVLPKSRGLAVVSFADLDAAIAAVGAILETGPSAVELLDDQVIRAAQGNAECRAYVELLPKLAGATPAAALYVEYQAEQSAAELDEFFAALRSVVGGNALVTYCDAGTMGRAWALRKASEALLHGLPGKAKPVTFVEDNSVPVKQLGRFVTEFKRIVARHGTTAAYYAHASVGVLHIRPMLDLHETGDREKMIEISKEAAALAKACGGVMSGEHGDGRVRGPLLEALYGSQIMTAFKRIKTIFDPAGILNPGNIVDALPLASIAQNLRVDGESPAIDLSKIDTYYQYAGEEGFAGAVEACNGAGFCRKTSGGTMCPSYRATLDERHSTRGRGNAIRVAVTGQTCDGQAMPSPDWNDPGVLGTLDLCLGCKACKTECPTNVDIAQLKSEYYAQRYRQLGAPLRVRLFGNVRRVNQLGSTMPGVANWLGRLRLVRRMLGLSPRRSLPAFAPSLHRWFQRRKAPSAVGRRRVAIWADCFVTYSEPHIGRAAVAVLEALGYAAELPGGGCCGRAMISTGLLDQAVATIDGTLAAMRPLIDDSRVEAIIVLEPSCLSAIRDEWQKLKLRTDLPTRQRLAAKAMSIEEFVERRWEEHPTRPIVPPVSPLAGREMIVHGHCHQKALWGMTPTAAALRRVAGPHVRILDSGCCGMAGAFGYVTEHYDLSMKIGELSVFPPIRAAGPDALIVAPGTSCRHQIRDGAGRSCLHPAEVLAMVWSALPV